MAPPEQLTFRVRKWVGGRPRTTTTYVSCLADECKDMCGPGTMYYFPTNDMSQPVKLPSAWDPAHAAWKTLRRAADPTAPRVILVLPDAARRPGGSPASTPRGDWTAVGLPLPDNFKAMFATPSGSGSAGDGSDSSTGRKSEWSRNIHSQWGDQCAITGPVGDLDNTEAAHIVSLGNEWSIRWPAIKGEYEETWRAAGQHLKKKEFRAFVMYKAAVDMPYDMACAATELNMPFNGILLRKYLHKRFDLFELSLYPSGEYMRCRAWRQPKPLRKPSDAQTAKAKAFMALDGARCVGWQDSWENARCEGWTKRLLALHHGICAVKNLGILQKQSKAERTYPLEAAQAAALQAQRLIAACVAEFEDNSLEVVAEEGGES